MEKITSLYAANEYLNQLAVKIFYVENMLQIVTATDHCIRLPYPEFEPCRDISSAFSLLTDYSAQLNNLRRRCKELPKEQHEKLKDMQYREYEKLRAFNAIIQSYQPPHQ